MSASQRLVYVWGLWRTLALTVPCLLKVDRMLSILRWLMLVYMAISSRDIVVLNRMMIHWISSETGLPILVESFAMRVPRCVQPECCHGTHTFSLTFSSCSLSSTSAVDSLNLWSHFSTVTLLSFHPYNHHGRHSFLFLSFLETHSQQRPTGPPSLGHRPLSPG